MPINFRAETKTPNNSPSSSQIFSPALWYDASDSSTVTLSGSTVSVWANKGSAGIGYNISQATASAQPSYSATQNGLKVMTFDGTNDRLTTTQLTSVTHIFVASAWSTSAATTASDKVLLSSNVLGDTFAADWGDSGISTTALIRTLSFGSGTYKWPAIQPTQSTSQLNGSNFVNLTDSKWSTFSIYSINLQSGYTGAFFGTGGDFFGSNTFEGSYGEIIVYQTSYLTAAQIETVTGYLANKWGTTSLLPSNFTYKSQSPFSQSIFYPVKFSGKTS